MGMDGVSGYVGKSE